ncbi:40S ribosomal protein S15 [Sceloporus undulatus]|uniref:40S ribosomal protein S15 n=1 Tax=Sceloporus undulatus TaxID=8520 RepID=UPI001C4C9DB0|nr:40S ribosomal protein S15 [Sceloporus undulatus]
MDRRTKFKNYRNRPKGSLLPTQERCCIFVCPSSLYLRWVPKLGTELTGHLSSCVSSEQLMQLYSARQRRRLNRGLRRKQHSLLKRLRKAKKEAPPMEKPEVVKTHLRDMIILPEMVGSMVGVYNGKTFNQVEIKPEMIGHYLGEFSITYKPVKHGRPGIGATHSSRFIPLK